MAFVEAEFRQQDRVSGELVIEVQHPRGQGGKGVAVDPWPGPLGREGFERGRILQRTRGDHQEDIEIGGVMLQDDLLAEAVAALGEGVPEDAIAVRTPEPGGGGAHAAVRPAVLVLDGDGLAAVAVPAVLDAAAVVVRGVVARQGQRRSVLRKVDADLPPDVLVVGLVPHERGVMAETDAAVRGDDHSHLVRTEPDFVLPEGHGRQLSGLLPRIVHQDFCRGRRLRVAHRAAGGIEEEPHDIGTVEIDGQLLPVRETDGGGGAFHGNKLLG